MNVAMAIDEFLGVVSQPNLESLDRVEKLIVILDQLAALGNSCEFVFDDRDHPEPPKQDHQEMRRRIGKLFPQVGFYGEATHSEDSISESVVVGDALDDIVDIAKDLIETKWRLENTSEADALFHFELLFRSHWGAHLRHLQLYLHLLYW